MSSFTHPHVIPNLYDFLSEEHLVALLHVYLQCTCLKGNIR